MISPSVSGTGTGVSEVDLSIVANVTGSFTVEGLLLISGTKLINPDRYKAEQAAFLANVMGTDIIDQASKMHWSDLMAMTLAVKSPRINPFRGTLEYMAGKRSMDSTSLRIIADEIVASNGKKDWNSIMAAKEKVDPVKQYTIAADDPTNPTSPYYNPNKPIFSYDDDYGYIIYRSGEVVWMKTGGQYYDAANGEAFSYNKSGHLLTFTSDAILNLKTLQLTGANKQVTTVKNTLPWYKQMLRQLLTDGKTQYTVLAMLVLLLIIKSKSKAHAV